MSKDICQISWKFASLNKQTKHMTSKKKLYYALLFMSSFSFGQSSSDQLKKLINSALERDGQYQQQNLELQYVDIDQKRLTDTFLPKVELTGKVSYMDTRKIGRAHV